MRTRSLLLVLAVLAGCSDSTDPPARDSGATPDGPAAREAGADQGRLDKGPPPDSKATASVCGTVYDTAGKPLVSHSVTLCSETVGQCIYDTSTATGAFCMSADEAGEWVVDVPEAKAGALHFSAVVFPVTVAAADVSGRKEISVGKVVVPQLGTAVELNITSGGTLDLGSGMKLTVAAGSATKPPLLAKVEVAGASVATTDAHSALTKLVTTGTVAALFAFAPVAVTFNPAAGFELPAGSLADGTSLDVYSLDEKYGKLVSEGQASVASGKIVSPSGGGTKYLSWLIFVKQ